ncbi:hypothetical protein Tco_0399367, partial [Tanacetum coccineum]
ALDNETSKLVVTLVYSWKPRKSKTNVPIRKSKVVQIVLWYGSIDWSSRKQSVYSVSWRYDGLLSYMSLVKMPQRLSPSYGTDVCLI